MNEQQIILADGTVLNNCGAGFDDFSLWIYPAMTMKEAADLFLDEEKTGTIIHRRSEESQTIYTGFTDCILMNVVPGGLRIQMTGTETSVEEGNESEE